MKVKVFPYLILLTLVCGALQTKGQQKSMELQKPNLILIIADDLGYADVGFNGSTEIPTPYIDRIANEGVKFTNGYVSYPVCGPSRAGIITGRYQDRFGFSRNPLFTPNDSLSGLPLAEETLADVLAKADYKCVALGKWHLGAHYSQHPNQRGFSDFYGFLSGGHHYFPEKWTLKDEFEAKTQFDGYKTKLLRNQERIEETEYLTDAISREAISYIDKYKEEPFFLYVAYNAPHTPMQATEMYLQRFSHIEDEKRRTYAAMVSAVDDGVGGILEKLKELELEEETIVCFISDNGGPLKINASLNTPLRGKKGDVFEGGLRVPFAMKWKGVIPPGLTFEEPVISLDIFATMVGQIAPDIDTKNEIDGVDLIPYISGDTDHPPHPFLYWRKYDQKHYAMRSGENKLIDMDGNRMYYNVEKDIDESENTIDRNKKTYEEEWTKFNEWYHSLQDPVFLGLRQNDQYEANHPDRFKRPETKK
ncbi:sulfatase-like hydrolase/transferase [Portibacter marinus]|uniref:sulfatase-like hydrolase/transferase n=1 Tax=Portibacter marinus TaxID=2898660 RepID=UPI001F454025|nr:sulfatase-like hydrolase/transferase [Portibacter marinus]